MRSLLHGANLDPKFWPYVVYYSLRIHNAIPERQQQASPTELATRQQDNSKNFRTFGYRVWVHPPGQKDAKLIPNTKKGIFLGFVPYTTRNLLWYDPEKHLMKGLMTSCFLMYLQMHSISNFPSQA